MTKTKDPRGGWRGGKSYKRETSRIASARRWPGGEAMSTSPHKNYKGCPLCKPHKDKRVGRGMRWVSRDPVSIVRKMGKRKYGRHDLPDGAYG